MRIKSFINLCLQSKYSFNVICLLLSLLILLPKALLVDYSNNALWGTFNYLTSLEVILQDIFLAIIYFFSLRWAYNKDKSFTLFFLFLLSGLLLATLLIDARVRELWLRPIDFDLISYSISNYRDLLSGSDAFFKYYAGFGMTFRRIAFVVAVIFLLLFAALFYLQKVKAKPSQVQVRRNRVSLEFLASAGVAFVLFVFAANGKNLAYNTEANVVVNPLVSLFKSQPSLPKDADSSAFEQPLHTLNNQEALADGAVRVKPFKNVIIVILESVRFKEFEHMNDDDDSSFRMPFLKKIASEGLLQKCYVSVPHTSKSQFAILSGRNPLADIEMRESMIGKVPSIVSLLKETKGTNSYFVTVQNLNFENTSGLLDAVGFEYVIDSAELSKHGKVTESSSFGYFDDALSNYPYSKVKQNAPFVLTLMTNAAHHPYDYPGKVKSEVTDYQAYLKSEEVADKAMARVFDKFRQSNLLDDTLVVIVGDHGESFGEHGTFIHNSSMYEEEVSVPLIFWSSDGRMKNIELRKQARQIDIAPTIADLVGVYKNENYTLQGTSLIKRSNVEPPIFISTFFSDIAQAVVHENVKVILSNGKGEITRYDLNNDPMESNGEVVNGIEREQYMQRFSQYRNYHDKVFEGARW